MEGQGLIPVPRGGYRGSSDAPAGVYRLIFKSVKIMAYGQPEPAGTDVLFPGFPASREFQPASTRVKTASLGEIMDEKNRMQILWMQCEKTSQNPHSRFR